jgi:diamine N-acetyltransferase
MNMLAHHQVILRALEPEDLDVVYRWENDTSIWHLSGTLVPYSRFILRKYLENADRDIFEMKQLRLIIEEKAESKPVGAIDLFDFDPYHRRAGIGILIAEKTDRGRGYARESLELLMNYAFEILKLHQLWCNIASRNTESLQLFKAAGFTVIGEKREWLFDGKGYQGEYLLQFIPTGTHERAS